MTDPKTWRECADAGMTTAEAAKVMGRTPAAARKFARRHGFSFRRDRSADAARAYKDPEFKAAHLARVQQFNSQPDFRKKRSIEMAARQKDPAFNPLAALTPEQREDYDRLKQAKFTRAEAFKAMGLTL